ncbi:MAG TPA: 2OG-Fe(II) oxygenase [Acidimicrobiales bacterium]|nr:2OG-Fe(II) oxygenase [Acidimicrobiales bacterium]
MERQSAHRILMWLLNDRTLFAAVQRITGCGSIGSFGGRVYRLDPSVYHTKTWHSDTGDARLVGLSINLGSQPFTGGELEIRDAKSHDILSTVHNVVPGDAVMFRIDKALQHRLANVRGDVAKTACAGWFKAQPVFEEIHVRM